MTPRTRKLSLFVVAAAVLALSSFTAAVPVPVPVRSDQLVISPDNVVIPSEVVPSEDVGLHVPDHDCGHDESDYEDFGDEEEDEEDEEDDSELESEDEQESTEEDLQAAGESEDDYYVGQTYTGLVFDSNTGKGIALTTVEPDQDLLELALFMRRKKFSSFEEIWNDIENSEGSDDGFEDDEATALAASDLNDMEVINDDEEEDDEAFDSET